MPTLLNLSPSKKFSSRGAVGPHKNKQVFAGGYAKYACLGFLLGTLLWFITVLVSPSGISDGSIFASVDQKNWLKSFADNPSALSDKFKQEPQIQINKPENVQHEETKPQPQQTNPQPEQTNPQPQQTNPQPQQTNPQPEQTNPQPEQTNPQPEQTNPQPQQTNSQPEQTYSQPQQTNPQP